MKFKAVNFEWEPAFDRPCGRDLVAKFECSPRNGFYVTIYKHNNSVHWMIHYKGIISKGKCRMVGGNRYSLKSIISAKREVESEFNETVSHVTRFSKVPNYFSK